MNTTTQPTETTKDLKRWEIRIDQDSSAENPNNYGILKVVSFNTRHVNFQDPNTLNDSEILTFLTYYEHGLCRWSVGADRPAKGWNDFDWSDFDTVGIAGAIVLQDKVAPSELKWFQTLLNDENRKDDLQKIFEATASEYTSWSNGEVFHYEFNEVVKSSVCSNCGHTSTVATDGFVDSCGGFIGDEYFTEVIKDLFITYDVQPNSVKVLGDFGYMIDVLPEVRN